MTWAAPVSQSFGTQFTPAIASDGEGGGIILWRQSGNSGDGYGGDLLYQTYVLSGNVMTLGIVRRTLSPFQANTNDAQDRFYIQYLEKEGNSHYYVMAYRWGTAGGNAFETVAVSGQSNIVADSTTDTLTFAAGTGITITTNASSDTLTITNSATGDNAFGTIAVSGQSNLSLIHI